MCTIFVLQTTFLYICVTLLSPRSRHGQQQHVVGVEEENQVVGGGTARIEVRREQRDLAAQTPPGLAEAQHGQFGAESFH